MYAYCLEDGWTVFQSRGQFTGYPKDFFLKGWEDYVNGFGIPRKEFNENNRKAANIHDILLLKLCLIFVVKEAKILIMVMHSAGCAT